MEFLIKIKEKSRELITLALTSLERLRQNAIWPRFKAMIFKTPPDRKKTLLIAAAAVLIIIIGAVAVLYFYNPPSKSKTAKGQPKPDIFSDIKKAELVGTFKINETARLGDLEITLYNIKEGQVRTLELNADGSRKMKAYFGAQVKVFNTSSTVTEYIAMGLEDDKGNQYEPDSSVAFYLDNIKDFGWAKDSYPRTIREGYLLFQAPAADAKKLQLIFLSNVSKKKIIFEIPR